MGCGSGEGFAGGFESVFGFVKLDLAKTGGADEDEEGAKSKPGCCFIKGRGGARELEGGVGVELL